MRLGFYCRTAFSNITKNYRFFVPRMIAEAGLLGVFFIIVTLKMDERIMSLRGGEYISFFMIIGWFVMMILSTILMLYINSFLMKQRKPELSLYNVLGMEKRQVGRILFHETFISGGISVLGGLGIGILFYKLCSLLICRLLDVEVIFGFDFIKISNIVVSAGFFVVLDVLTYLLNRITLHRLNPVELLSSRAQGEKEPKVKWVLFLLGLLSLGGGYWISLSIVNPVEALYFFFLAVILVIVGTYFLFISGSIFFLKMLKRKAGYYYHRKHMLSISGLLYRMKQNATGLASICILATGVLVMISTTVSLYAGTQDTLQKNYPHQLIVEAWYANKEGTTSPVPSAKIEQVLNDASASCGLEIAYLGHTESLTVNYVYRNGVICLPNSTDDLAQLPNIVQLIFITQEEYRRVIQSDLLLKEDEIAVCSLSASLGSFGIQEESVSFLNRAFHVKQISSFPTELSMSIGVNTIGVVVPALDVMEEINLEQVSAFGDNASEYRVRVLIDYTDEEKASWSIDDLSSYSCDKLEEYFQNQENYDSNVGFCIGFDSVWRARDSYMSMTASFLFLGIILGLVCLFATVVIIYYKQIAEGYEDRERFQILKKIGMCQSEIRGTINKQIWIVFFLPLVAAGIHLIFAFPILEKLLHILLLTDTQLFILCSLVTFGIFALVYTCIYLTTARTYYRIVR